MSQDAIQRMYEDTSVRDELIDEEAEILLRWGEGQITQLSAQNADPLAAEEALLRFLRMLARVNRFVGRRGDPLTLPMRQQKLVETANEAGYPLQLAHVEAFTQQHAAADNFTVLHELIALLESTKGVSQTYGES